MERRPSFDDSFMSGIINDANYIETDEEVSDICEECNISHLQILPDIT